MHLYPIAINNLLFLDNVTNSYFFKKEIETV